MRILNLLQNSFDLFTFTSQVYNILYKSDRLPIDVQELLKVILLTSKVYTYHLFRFHILLANCVHPHSERLYQYASCYS